MLLPASLTGYTFTYDNWGAAPGFSPGTSITPGTSNAEGAWTQIASGANIAQDCYWIYLMLHGSTVTGQTRPVLMDIGVDPAGGTSYTAVISNLVCGNNVGTNLTPRHLAFPFFIKAGSSVAARFQGAYSVASAIGVAAKFYGQPTRPENAPVGMFSETLGTITNSNGTSFTPGNGAYGSWVSLGTTTKPLWWWQLGVQIDNATMNNSSTWVDLGVGDVTNKNVIMKSYFLSDTSERNQHPNTDLISNCGCYWPVPAGAELWVRGWNGGAPVTGYNATVIGIGG